MGSSHRRDSERGERITDDRVGQHHICIDLGKYQYRKGNGYAEQYQRDNKRPYAQLRSFHSATQSCSERKFFSQNGPANFPNLIRIGQ